MQLNKHRIELIMPERTLILLAEPEEATRESVEMILTDEGYDCYTVCDSESLLRAIHIHRYDLIIADINIVHAEIREILSALGQYPARSPILVTLTYERIGEMLELIKFGVTEYLLKPFPFEDLVERVEKLISHKTNTNTKK